MTAEPFNFHTPPAGRAGGIAHEWLTASCRVAAREPLALEMALSSIEPAVAGEAIRSLPGEMLGYAIEIGDHPACLALTRPLLLALIATRLGEPLNELPLDRELTAVESDLADYLVPLLLGTLRQTWPGPAVPTITIRATGSPRVVSRLLHDAPVLVATLSLTVGVGHWPMKLIIPITALPEESSSSHTSGTFDRQELEQAVRDLPLEIDVELGRAILPLRQLISLAPNDLVLLDQAVDEPLVARLGGTERFAVWAGARGRSRAVRIHATRPESG